MFSWKGGPRSRDSSEDEQTEEVKACLWAWLGWSPGLCWSTSIQGSGGHVALSQTWWSAGRQALMWEEWSLLWQRLYPLCMWLWRARNGSGQRNVVHLQNGCWSPEWLLLGWQKNEYSL